MAGGIAMDRSGVRGPFLAGLGLFAIGLVVGGLAPSMPILVLGRIIQGASGGLGLLTLPTRACRCWCREMLPSASRELPRPASS